VCKFYIILAISKINVIFKHFIFSLSSYYPDIEFPDIGQTKGLSMLILTETNYLGQTSTFKQVLKKDTDFKEVLMGH